MFCTKCGSQLIEGSVFCHKCGAKLDMDLINSMNEKTPVQSSPAAQPSSVKKQASKAKLSDIKITQGIEYYGGYDSHFLLSCYDNEIYEIHLCGCDILVFNPDGELLRSFNVDGIERFDPQNFQIFVNQYGVFVSQKDEKKGELIVYKYSYEGEFISKAVLTCPQAAKEVDSGYITITSCISDNSFAYAFSPDADILGTSEVGIYSFDTGKKTVVTKAPRSASIEGFYDGLLCIKADFTITLTAEDLAAVPALGNWNDENDKIYSNYHFIIDIVNKKVVCLENTANPFFIQNNRNQYLEAVNADTSRHIEIKAVHLKEKIIWVETQKGIIEPRELVFRNGSAHGANSSRYPVFNIENSGWNGYYFDGKTFINLSDSVGCACIDEYNEKGLFSSFRKYSHTDHIYIENFSIFGNKLYFPCYDEINILERSSGEYTIIRLDNKYISWA